MNFFAVIFFLATAGGLWMASRKWAPLFLLLGCCYMTMGQGIHLGPFSLPVYRMLLAVGLLRVILKREWVSGGLNTVDKMMIVWACWLAFASFFHEFTPGSGPIFASGVIFNFALSYFLIRIWCRDLNEIGDLTKFVAVLLVPIAAEMAMEKVTGKDLFAALGGVPVNAIVRAGKIRAEGPFRHPILAGTVGATCLPLMIGIWRQYRGYAILGIGACLVMTLASASSGPIMSLLIGVFALVFWRFQGWTKAARWAAVLTYLVLNLAMTRPAYYLISRIDLAKGSTGWHRARLIDSTIGHFSEWWLFGTSYTLHWMPDQGNGAGDGRNTDITNYYITFAVLGGVLSLLLFLAILWFCFRWIGAILRTQPDLPESDRFLIWSFGAGLFAHAATSLSVAYFDQSMVFFWLNVAVISSLYSILTKAAPASLPEAEAELTEAPGARLEGFAALGAPRYSSSSSRSW